MKPWSRENSDDVQKILQLTMVQDIGSVADWKITSRQERGRTSSKVSLSDLSSPDTTCSNNNSIVLEMRSLIFIYE